MKTRIRLMFHILAIPVLILSALWPAFGEGPEFEVAAIKLNAGGPPWMSAFSGFRPGTMTWSMATPQQLIMAAYGMSSARVDGPEWLDHDHFDLLAKSPAGASDKDLKLMLQTLLKVRFQLVTHTESREMAVYDLVVAKGGVKMPVYPAPQPRGNPSYKGPHGMMMSTRTTTAKLAEGLSSMGLGRPVVDRTKLNAQYNVTLEYAPLTVDAANATEFGPPDIFKAVQEQLGLRLVPSKAKLDVIVVDHMERMPTEN